jgi:hypothetical protein
MKLTTIKVCADDFGQDRLINDAVLKLFEAKRLSATSVLIDGTHVNSYIQEIQIAHKNGLEVGLHFNLTLGFPDSIIHSIKPLYQWILLSQLGLINANLVRQTFLSQLSKFESLFGFLPDYIDGHQHVHQFPGIGQIIVEEVLHHYPEGTLPWIRNTILPSGVSNIPQVSKCFILQFLGGQHFRKMLSKSKISSNSGFLGVYGFNASTETNYRSLFQAWLKNSQMNSLIMCHPALSPVSEDAIGYQRPIEFNYLSSQAFQEDLERFNISVA